MNPLISCLFLLPLTLASLAAPACKIVAGVETTCKALAKAQPSIPYDYCVATLNANPNSPQEDLKGLASSVVRLAVSHVQSTETRMEDLMDLEQDHAAKMKYDACEDAFNDAGDLLRDACDSIATKQHAKATRLLRAALGARERCNKAFGEGRSPVSSADGEYEQLAQLAAAIMSMVD